MNRTLVIAAAAVVLIGGGGGYGYYKRSRDPMRRADAALEQNNYRAAEIELRNAIVKQPNDPEAHLRLAQVAMKLADPVAAEKQFRAAAALGGDKWVIIPQLGEALIAQGNFRDTLRQIPPNGPTPVIAAKNLLLRSIAQLGTGDAAAAAATLEELKRVAPDRVEVFLITARLAAARNDFTGTEAAVDEALKRDPNEVEALLMKENLLTSKNDRPAALAVADRAVKSAPWSAMARMDRANQLIFANQDDKAQADVDAVLAVQPRFSDAVYLNGVLMARRGKFAEAAIQLGKLENGNTRFPQVYFYQALVASRLGQAESAAEYARRYNTLVPNDPEGRRVLGEAELAAKRPDRALPVLEKAVATGPKDAATLDALGRTYVALNYRPSALAAFTEAAALAPKDAVILAHLGLAQMQQGDPKQATESLERSLTVSPTERSASEALVEAAMEDRDFPKAEAALAKLRAQVGETEMVGILTGALRVRKGDMPGAQAAFTDTLRAFPASITAKINLARLLAQTGRVPQAVNLLNDALAKDPANLQVLGGLLPILAQDNQVGTAIQVLEVARKADPKSPVIAAMLADAYTSTGKQDRALTLLAGIGRPEGLPPILLAPLARAHVAAGNTADAKAAYRLLMTATPTDMIARSAQVALMLNDRDIEGARAALREALAATPGNYRVMQTMLSVENAATGFDGSLKLADELRRDPKNLPASSLLKGDMLTTAGRHAEAARAFQAEFDEAPSLPMVMRLTAALSNAGQDAAAADKLRAWLKDHGDATDAAQALAKLEIKAKRYPDAVVHLQAVLARRPNDPGALNNLAWVYYLTGNTLARATAQKAYLAAPTSDAADTLGWIMAQEGANQAAIPILKQSAASRPSDPVAQYHLAVALKNDGQTDEAAKVLKPLVEGTAAFDDRPAAVKLLGEISRKN